MKSVEQIQTRTTRKELVTFNIERNDNGDIVNTLLQYNTSKTPIIKVLKKGLVRNAITESIRFRKSFFVLEVIQKPPMTCLLHDFIKNARISFEFATEIPLFECIMSDIFQFINKYHEILPELTMDDFYISNISNRTSVFGEVCFLFRFDSKTILHFVSKEQLQQCLNERSIGEWNTATLEGLWEQNIDNKKPNGLGCDNLRKLFDSIKKEIEIREIKLGRKPGSGLPLYCDFDMFLERIRKSRNVNEILADNFIAKCLRRKQPFKIDGKFIQFEDNKRIINLKEYYPLILRKGNDEHLFLKCQNKIYKTDCKQILLGCGGFGVVVQGRYINDGNWENHECVLSTNNPSIKKRCEMLKKQKEKEGVSQQYEDVAVKIFTLKDKTAILKEVEMLTTLYDIPCLIKSFGIVDTCVQIQSGERDSNEVEKYQSIATITKLYNEKTLTEYVEVELRKGTKPLRERNIEEMIIMTLDIMNGASALGRLDIWHRDHKGDNIFVYKENGMRRCVIGDIGCARFITKRELCLDTKKTNVCSYARGDTRKDNDIYKVGICLVDFLLENNRMDNVIRDLFGMGNGWDIADQMLFETIKEELRCCNFNNCSIRQKEFYELLQRIVGFCVSRYNSIPTDNQHGWDMFDNLIEELRQLSKERFGVNYSSDERYKPIRNLCNVMTMLFYSDEINLFMRFNHPSRFDSILLLAISCEYEALTQQPKLFYDCILELVWFVAKNVCDKTIIVFVKKLLHSVVHDVFPFYFTDHPLLYQQSTTLQELLQTLVNEY